MMLANNAVSLNKCSIQGSNHPELSGCITTLIVRNMEVENFGAAIDTLIDQDGFKHTTTVIEVMFTDVYKSL